jgi:hypothetical protein
MDQISKMAGDLEIVAPPRLSSSSVLRLFSAEIVSSLWYATEERGDTGYWAHF